MNDPNKAIDVNLSSLLSLKAELLRKQSEVSKAKASRCNVSMVEEQEYQANNAAIKIRDKNSDVTKKLDDKKPDKVVYEMEDNALLEKSKRVLQAKSKYYERMTRLGGKLNSDDNCLVLFNRKHQEEQHAHEEDTYQNSSSSSGSDSDDDDAAEKIANDEDSADDWVEYTDCLGRTRKCLRIDLPVALRRDKELADSMPERLDQSKANWMLDVKQQSAKTQLCDAEDDAPMLAHATESIYSDAGVSLMSKHDEQRANWERKEQENLEKPDVHYQDVFFDEARQHGTGYYAFSTDEEERKRQQRDLEQARKITLAEQKQRDELRAQRDKIIAERVLAAKNRQRARLGLPALASSEEAVEQETKTNETTTTVETKEERKARKKAAKLQRKQQREEEQRAYERLQHVRPWDKPKVATGLVHQADKTTAEEAADWQYKKEREPMSQAAWNEHKRAERIAEFAPVPEVSQQLKRTNFNSMPPPATPTTAATTSYEDDIGMRNNFNAFQSTKTKNKFVKRSYTNADEEQQQQQSATASRQRAAIPPPANLDNHYELPAKAKRSKTQNELENSIEAGLRFIRESCDKNTLSSKSTWTAKADY